MTLKWLNKQPVVIALAMLGLGGLIVLVGLITYLALERTKQDTTTTPSIKLFDQDETANLGGVEWQVQQVEFLNGTLLGRDNLSVSNNKQAADLKAEGMFLRVHYQVSNKKQQTVSFVASEVELVGEDNREHKYLPKAEGWIAKNKQVYLKPLESGESVVVTMIYDVPIKQHYSLKVTDLNQLDPQTGLINLRS